MASYEDLLNLFADRFLSVSEEMFGIEMSDLGRCHQSSPSFMPQHEMVTMLDFRGSAIGFLALSCQELSIAKMIGIDELPKDMEALNTLRGEYGGALSEILNVITGILIERLKEDFPIITILTPKILFTQHVIYPEVECQHLMVETELGHFEFSISVDSMQQDILKLLNEAKEASKAKGEFLATMSHEIRTPINGVIGMTELLLSTAQTPEQLDYTQTIYQSAEALLTVISDILDFSKIEAGKLELENIEFDLYKSLENCIDVIAPILYKKDLNIALLIDRNVPQTIKGDPARIRQIILNFLSNSVKFTDKGELTLRVGLRSENETHIELIFSVEDQGVGISQEGQERLFKSFSQVDASTTRKYGGTGLGLAIAKMLVEKMNGVIGVESTTGKGSNFWFTTKHELVDDEQYKGLPRHHYQTHSTRSEVGFEPKEILLIDSNPNDIKFFQHYTEMYAYQLTSQSDWSQAQAAYESNGRRPHLIIIDCSKKNTLHQQVRFIRENLFFNNIPFLIIVEYSFKMENENDVGIEYMDYFSKPLKLKHLNYCSRLLMDQDVETVVSVRKNSLLSKPQTQNEQRVRKILIVEDNIINQKVIAKMITKMGFEFDLAENGKIALEMVQKTDYDLVFMDCQMPVMNGYDATREIRAQEVSTQKRVSIVALTANVSDVDRQLCMDCGMDDFLGKPSKSDQLFAMIQKYGFKDQPNKDR